MNGAYNEGAMVEIKKLDRSVRAVGCPSSLILIHYLCRHCVAACVNTVNVKN
jgi:hypothetical protein